MKTCIYPNNILVIGNDGNTISCPLETANSKIASINNGIINAWNDTGYDTFRYNLDSLLSDKTKICWQCNKLEQNSAISLRTENPAITDAPELKGIQFKLSNRCQLVCAHCGPLLSSSWAKFIGKTDTIQQFDLDDSIIDELAEILPTLDLIRFTGGEPWMDPIHWKILRKLKDVDKGKCELHYITNGLSTIRPELWESWKTVKIMLSVDGYGEAYEWFRRKASWKDLITAYETLQKIKNVEIVINYSLTPWTINYLDAATKFFDTKIMTVPIMSPYHCSLASISKEDAAIIGLTDYPKYSNIIGSNPMPLTKLKTWANSWDTRWETPGWAEKIHPWLQFVQ